MNTEADKLLQYSKLFDPPANQIPLMYSPARLMTLVVLLWAAGLGAAGQFAKISIILPELSALYPGHGASIGFLVSLISVLGVVFGLVAGALLNEIGAKKLLLMTLSLGCLCSLFQAALPPFPAMLASRLLEGLSHLGVVVAAPTLIASLTPSKHRGLAMSLWATFFGVAFALIALLGIPLVEMAGPQALILAHGIYMAIMVIALALALPTDLIVQPSANSSTSLKQLLKRHQHVYASPYISAPALGWLFYAAGFVSMVTVLPNLLPAADRIWVASAMPLSTIAVSMTLGIYLLKRMQAVIVITLGFSATILIAILFLLLPLKPWMPIALTGAMGLVQGASFTAIPQLNPCQNDQALANGAMAQTGNLGNLLGIPLILLVLDHFSIDIMMIVFIALYAVGLGSHIATAKARKK